jgi:hypothetical protein
MGQLGNKDCGSVIFLEPVPVLRGYGSLASDEEQIRYFFPLTKQFQKIKLKNLQEDFVLEKLVFAF